MKPKAKRTAGRPLLIPIVTASAALVLWVVPLPAPLIERWYARGVYPAWQRIATTTSNFLPLALFDLLIVAAIVMLMLIGVRAWRTRAWRIATARLLLLVGIAGLWFQLAWGLNYRRQPIAETMGLAVGTGAGGALETFALASADTSAALADQLDRTNPLSPSRVLADLSEGFVRAQRKAGLTSLARPGRPKRSLFDPYYRWAAIDGVTDPFIPETIVVSGLTPAEAYMTVAHEWAHLAGYASEDEANFVGWLTCLESGGGPRYNAWLFALTKALRAAPQGKRREWLARAGPVAARDLAAIRARFQTSSPTVRKAASAAYDQFLRANRVEGGIESYDQVLRLMLAYGTAR